MKFTEESILKNGGEMENKKMTKKERAEWTQAWLRKIDEMSRMWTGSCTAYAKQGEELLAKLRKLTIKVSETLS
jgi:hypothetical protein